MIIIISTPTDPHLPFVTKHLKRREYVVLDVGVIAQDKRLTYKIGADGFAVNFANDFEPEDFGIKLFGPLVVRGNNGDVVDAF